MIFIHEKNICVKSPEEIKSLDVDTKNIIHKNLNIGRVFFEFPQDFDFVKNKHRDVYKIGFLYECLELVYPDISKTSKYDIINLKYHFFITYRRFKDLLDEYYASKKKYLENRNLL